eukprot:3492697-Prymnesium_polylepis.1
MGGDRLRRVGTAGCHRIVRIIVRPSPCLLGPVCAREPSLVIWVKLRSLSLKPRSRRADRYPLKAKGYGLYGVQ